MINLHMISDYHNLSLIMISDDHNLSLIIILITIIYL